MKRESKEPKCNHSMFWNIQEGYAYYRCGICDYINGEETFSDYIPKKREIEEYKKGYNQCLKDFKIKNELGEKSL